MDNNSEKGTTGEGDKTTLEETDEGDKTTLGETDEGDKTTLGETDEGDKTTHGTSQSLYTSSGNETGFVRRLLSKWEISASTGTPMRPDSEMSDDDTALAPVCTTVKRMVKFTRSPPLVQNISACEMWDQPVVSSLSLIQSASSNHGASVHIDLFAEIQEGLQEASRGIADELSISRDEDEKEEDVLSVLTYRKISFMDRKAVVESDPHGSATSIISIPPEDAGEERVKRLQKEMATQHILITQTRKALSRCHTDEFSGSHMEIEAHRLSLLATERRNVLQSECEKAMSELEFANSQSNNVLPSRIVAYEPKGVLTITRIAVQLSKPFLREAVKTSDQCIMLALLKIGEMVIPTQLACTSERMEDVLELAACQIHLRGLRPDASVVLEVYSTKNAVAYRDSEPKKDKGINLLKVFKKSGRSTNSSVAGTSDSERHWSRSTEKSEKPKVNPGFQLVGHIQIKSAEFSQEQFKFLEPAHPLEGSLFIELGHVIYLSKPAIDPTSGNERGDAIS